MRNEKNVLMKALYLCKFNKEEQSVIFVASYFDLHLVPNYIP